MIQQIEFDVADGEPEKKKKLAVCAKFKLTPYAVFVPPTVIGLRLVIFHFDSCKQLPRTKYCHF
jgi:hypothetical protein